MERQHILEYTVSMLAMVLSIDMGVETQAGMKGVELGENKIVTTYRDAYSTLRWLDRMRVLHFIFHMKTPALHSTVLSFSCLLFHLYGLIWTCFSLTEMIVAPLKKTVETFLSFSFLYGLNCWTRMTYY